MKIFFKPNEGKNKEKLRNNENSKTMKLLEIFDISIFRVYRRLKKRLKSMTKASIF